MNTHTCTRCAVVVVTDPVCLLRRRTLDLFPSHQHLRTGVENNAPKSYQFPQISLQNRNNFASDDLFYAFLYQILKSHFHSMQRFASQERRKLTPMQTAKQTSSLTHTRAQNSLELFHHQETEKIFLLGIRPNEKHTFPPQKSQFSPRQHPKNAQN